MGVWAIFKKEMRLYFTSPVAYVVFTFFLLGMGGFFYNIFAFYDQMSRQAAMNPAFARDLNVTDAILRPLFSNTGVILLFVVPMVTMRLFAEEKRSGTIELLLTFPVRDGEVMLGKFAAAMALVLVLLGFTALYPAIVAYFTRVEWGPLLSGYLGLMLLGGAFLAVGLLISSLTENQIIASVVTFFTLLVFWIIGWFADSVGGNWRVLFQYLSIPEHLDSFGKGVIDTKDVVYYLTAIVLSLFLTLRALESKRWRG
ncbi:MAG: ABC transporter permease subunit [Candidatus Rokubacteria bacterium]|nr:ABC transporter permease subunit [Candidatus Rokubacteria bacterium]